MLLAWLAAGDVGLDEQHLNAARRRAMLVLAAGGDPHRELEHDSVAAVRLATELDTPERRAKLAAALERLADAAAGLPTVSQGLATLLGDPEFAWRTFALALLADELAEE